MPIKKAIQQIDITEQKTCDLEERMACIRQAQTLDSAYEGDVRSLMLESLIAILEALEKSGANGSVAEVKKKLLSFLSKPGFRVGV
jgi:uncharacterized protein YxjI